MGRCNMCISFASAQDPPLMALIISQHSTLLFLTWFAMYITYSPDKANMMEFQNELHNMLGKSGKPWPPPYHQFITIIWLRLDQSAFWKELKLDKIFSWFREYERLCFLSQHSYALCLLTLGPKSKKHVVCQSVV